MSIQQKHPKMEATCISLDIITTLPQPIIEIILCLLPIQEAARTSILSKEWRYKWTKIPKLVFSESTVKEDKYWSKRKKQRLSDIEHARRSNDKRCKLLCAIHQVLLQCQGPIHEFTLSMNGANCTCFVIDQIILHLSRNHTLKKLKLDFNERCTGSLYGLPLSVFSLHHLTDLYLECCDVNIKPIFNGFDSLTSLTLYKIMISREALLHLLSNCQSLRRLCIILQADALGDEEICIMELFKCLPVIEHLTIVGDIIRALILPSVSKELSTSLVHLRYVCVDQLNFGDSCGLTFFGVLMKCSPNLEKIKLKIEVIGNSDELDPIQLEEYLVMLEKYSDVCLEHLNELDIGSIRNLKLETMLVKFVIARSPNLKKVVLRPWIHNRSEELEMLKTLLHLSHASPVEIVVGCFFERFKVWL